MEAIFGWFNVWLPESLQLPPVVWAMTCFGILAHFMARTTYQPYSRKRRGVAASSMGGRAGGGSGGLWGDLGGTGHPYPPFAEGMGDFPQGFGAHGAFAGFPQPPGGVAGMAGGGGAPGGAPSGDAGGAPLSEPSGVPGGSCDQGGAAASGVSGRGGRVRSRGSSALEASPEGSAVSSRGEPRPQGPKAPLGLGHALRSPPGRAD
ncbi:unnamed protein product [Prorocentrum cordatum]|uniref:Uncharacterized protein n=1 Tax=Prorocentrum cordatum TaxID=2364126 RepID=A0ABN9TIL2_9DINO|nr:unnamed protein product [Polarella glacialis]